MRAPTSLLSIAIAIFTMGAGSLTRVRAQTVTPSNTSGANVVAGHSHSGPPTGVDPMGIPIGGTGHKRRHAAVVERAAGSTPGSPAAPLGAPVGTSTHKRRHETVTPTGPLGVPVGGPWHKRRHASPAAQLGLGANVFVSTLGPLADPLADPRNPAPDTEQGSDSTSATLISTFNQSPPVESLSGSVVPTFGQNPGVVVLPAGQPSTSQPTPEPSVLLLLGTGLLAVAMALRQHRRSTAKALTE